MIVGRRTWRKYGTVEANRENAQAAFDAGAAVLVYPGGDWEAHRPSWHGGRIEFAGREGFIRLALAADVPIVPVVSIGGQETALFLTRGERLARALQLDRRFRLKVLPVSLALPWGIDVGDFFGHLALPAKITIQVLEPIQVRARFGSSPDIDTVGAPLASQWRHPGAIRGRWASGNRALRRTGGLSR
jgi:1-acyl-sn-glycerol-3-phosphate acyltransferase